ncbi:Predicted alkaloid synthase/Surface mucin Hemomucin [Ceraceosorus bombacis]|uniref:Predicted alkaloid synthase/Surface mucin Hemomucin n=1 Tax=Ceraceosorus bombacis TaxID=401625 RepID=A0A0P1BD28_9BASI|nr:Predicted alkaloid synthase/Surface mucin Hemomucin [Ceraceosorus bombacis]
MTNSTSSMDAEPQFQTYSSGGDKLLGRDPEALILVHRPGYAFAHEAPVWFADTQDVWFASNAGGKNGKSNLTTNNAIFRINLPHALPLAKNGTATFENSVETIYSPLVEGKAQFEDIQMTNGATSYGDAVLLCNTGRDDLPGSLVLVNRSDIGQKPKVLLNNAYGRDFVSPNDVVVHPKGAIFFTDADYGVLQNFKPPVAQAKATWRFVPTTGELRMIDATITTPNGIALSPDARTLYVTETGLARSGAGTDDYSIPAVIYAFDLDTTGSIVSNKRTFTNVPTGIADGIKTDSKGNVYTCTGGGLEVYAPRTGQPLYRFFLPTGCTQVVMVQDGRLLLLAEETIWYLRVASHVQPAPIASYPRSGRLQGY